MRCLFPIFALALAACVDGPPIEPNVPDQAPSTPVAPPPVLAPALAAPTLAAESSPPLHDIELADGTRLQGVVVTEVAGAYLVIDTKTERVTVPWKNFTIKFEVPRGNPGKVMLLDGSKIEGIIKRQAVGQYVIVTRPDGAEVTIAWRSIKSVEVAKPD